MNWRCWFGHADGAPFSAEAGTLNVRCVECGRVSGGAAIPAAAPRLTQAGDPHRHVIRKIRLQVSKWKGRWAA